MAETILITGATGMVGKALTKVLLVQGYKINVLAPSSVKMLIIGCFTLKLMNA